LVPKFGQIFLNVVYIAELWIRIINYDKASSSSTLVEHLTHRPRVGGSSRAIADGKGIEKTAINKLIKRLRFV
jgi:hypothetical protein